MRTLPGLQCELKVLSSHNPNPKHKQLSLDWKDGYELPSPVLVARSAASLTVRFASLPVHVA